MPRINEIDRQVLGILTPADKMKALLKERGLSVTGFARKYNHWVSQVSRCLNGKQPLEEIRDDLAAELDWTRQQVDDLLAEREAA